MSRSSSGFESGHLASPEHPALPLTLASIHLKTSPNSILPCILQSLTPPQSSQNPAQAHLPSGAIARSLSFPELRGNSAPGTTTGRSFSLQKDQTLLDPKDWNLPASSKSEDSRHHKVNPPEHFEVMLPFPASFDDECSSLNVDTSTEQAKQAETTQSTHLPTGRSNHPVTPLSFPRLPSTTGAACTELVSSENKRVKPVSASAEARRLQTKRNQKTSVNSVNSGSLVDEN